MYWPLGLGYLVLYALVGWALGGDPFARTIAGSAGIALAAAAVVVVVLRRRREWAGCQLLFWNTVGIGMMLWLVGHAGWAFDSLVREQPTWLHWHTLFSLCGAICPLIALLTRPHRGVRSGSVPAVGFDMASYGLLALFIYAYFVLIPSLGTDTAATEVTLFTLVQANRLLLLIGMSAFAWSARHTAWRATYLRLAAGVAIGFFPRILLSSAIVRGTYQTGTLYDLAWLGPWLCYAWAALEAPSSDMEGEPTQISSQGLPAVFGVAPVFLVPLVGYTWFQTHSIGASGDAFRELLTSVVTVAGLGLLTLRLASQGDALQRADARVKLLAAATEQTRDLIVIIDANGRFEHANDAFLRALGYMRGELAALPFADLLEGGGNLLENVTDVVREHGVWRGTVTHKRRDGSTFPASCTVVALRNASGAITHYVGVERDATDEMKLRDQLVHSERLSAMAELIGGVAHEINNPLQTIIGAAELMLQEAPAPSGPEPGADALRRDLELVRSEAGRAGQIVRNLLSFIRRSAPDRALADLNDIVRTTVQLRQYGLQQRNIASILHCHASPLPVLVNREEIQQIVLNLLLNAEQAIASVSGDAAGTITVRTSRTPRVVIAEVADDGPGVCPEARGRIFEPFFTTKEVGQGTGLGLSISHGIASAHGGSLELCPSSGGACFRLTLPAADARPQVSAADFADSRGSTS
jgi:PAS domain S-box-containing protein